MRKYQNSLLAFMLVFLVVQTIDAAPRRNRRRARRSSQTYTTRTNNSTTTYRTWNYQSSPPRHSNSTIIPSANNNIASQPAISNAVTTPRSTAQVHRTLKPQTLNAGDLLPIVAPIDSTSAVATENHQAPVGGTTSNGTVASDRSVVLASYDQAPTQVHNPSPNTVAYASSPNNSSSAIAEVNAIRVRRGLRPFIEDRALSAIANRKAWIQANRRSMGHPGGSMGGARYEGVGMGRAFTTCYLYSNGGQYAGAASVRGSNGQRYHCLLIR